VETVDNPSRLIRMPHPPRASPDVDSWVLLPTTPGSKPGVARLSTVHPIDSVEMIPFTLSAKSGSTPMRSPMRSQAYITVV